MLYLLVIVRTFLVFQCNTVGGRRAIRHRMQPIHFARLRRCVVCTISFFFVVKIDLRKAFDSLKQSLVAKLLMDAVSRGLSPIMAFALIAEVSNRGATAHFPGCSSTFFLFKEGFGQGPSEPPALFTAVLDMLLAEAVQRWREKGWGLDPSASTILFS